MYAFDNSIVLYKSNGYIGFVDINFKRFESEFTKQFRLESAEYSHHDSRSGNYKSNVTPTILADDLEDAIGNNFKVFKWSIGYSSILIVAESQSVVKRYIKQYLSEYNEIGTITELGRVKCYGRNRNGFYI